MYCSLSEKLLYRLVVAIIIHGVGVGEIRYIGEIKKRHTVKGEGRTSGRK